MRTVHLLRSILMLTGLPVAVWSAGTPAGAIARWGDGQIQVQSGHPGPAAAGPEAALGAFAGESREASARPDLMIDVGGRKLNCSVYGQGAPTVVLVSGLDSPRKYWDSVIPSLADLIPGGRLVGVEGVGHEIHVDKPEALIVPVTEMIEAARRKGRD